MRRFVDALQTRRFFSRVPTAEIRSLSALAAPVTASLGVGAITSLVNTAILAPLGAEALAMSALATSVGVFVFAAVAGLLAVAPVSIGHAFGADDDARVAALVREWAGLSLGVGVISYLLFVAALPLLPWMGQPGVLTAQITPFWLAAGLTFLTYPLFTILSAALESVHRAWTSFVFTCVTVALGAPLAWVFTHGWGAWPGLGVIGPALGTFVAGVTVIAFMLAYLRFAPSFARWRKAARVKGGAAKIMVTEGAVSAAQYFLEGAAFAVCGLMMGWLGVEALAAHQVVLSVGGLLYVLPLAISYAVSIRIAQAAGGANAHRVLHIGVAAFIVVIAISAACTLILLSQGRALAQLLTEEPAIAALAGSILFAYGVMQVFDGVQTVAVGALRGLMVVRMPAVTSIIGYWCVATPLSYVFAFVLGWGALGVWYGFGFGLLAVSIPLVARFVKEGRARFAAA